MGALWLQSGSRICLFSNYVYPIAISIVFSCLLYYTSSICVVLGQSFRNTTIFFVYPYQQLKQYMYHCSISVSPHTSMYIYVYEEWKAPISSNARVVFTTYTYYQNQSLFFLQKMHQLLLFGCVVEWRQKNSLKSYLKRRNCQKKIFPLRAHLTCVEGLLMGRLEKVF